MTDLPGYGGGVYCRECYSTNHQTQQCPHLEDNEEHLHDTIHPTPSPRNMSQDPPQ